MVGQFVFNGGWNVMHKPTSRNISDCEKWKKWDWDSNDQRPTDHFGIALLQISNAMLLH